MLYLRICCAAAFLLATTIAAFPLTGPLAGQASPAKQEDETRLPPSESTGSKSTGSKPISDDSDSPTRFASGLRAPSPTINDTTPKQGCFRQDGDRFCWFSGEVWWVRNGLGGPGVGCFTDAEDRVFVDEDGRLHLILDKVENSNVKGLAQPPASPWCQTEVRRVAPARFGRHRFELSHQPTLAGTDVVLGMFLYREVPVPPDGCQASGCAYVEFGPGTTPNSTDPELSTPAAACLCEADIEITGAFETAPCNRPPAGNPVLFHVVHPGNDKTCRWHPFPSDPGDPVRTPTTESSGASPDTAEPAPWLTTTHDLKWQPGKVRFDSFHGFCSTGDCRHRLGKFTHRRGFVPSIPPARSVNVELRQSRPEPGGRPRTDWPEVIVNLWLCDQRVDAGKEPPEKRPAPEGLAACIGRLDSPYEMILNSYEFEPF